MINCGFIAPGESPTDIPAINPIRSAAEGNGGVPEAAAGVERCGVSGTYVALKLTSSNAVLSPVSDTNLMRIL